MVEKYSCTVDLVRVDLMGVDLEGVDLVRVDHKAPNQSTMASEWLSSILQIAAIWNYTPPLLD